MKNDLKVVLSTFVLAGLKSGFFLSPRNQVEVTRDFSGGALFNTMNPTTAETIDPLKTPSLSSPANGLSIPPNARDPMKAT